MQINHVACTVSGGERVLSATVVWEEQDFPAQRLIFEIGEPQEGDQPIEPAAESDPLVSADDPSPDAFLAACFPLAAIFGEARIRIEGRACPMLVEGLRTAHAWWSSWGGMPAPAPEIETQGAVGPVDKCAPRRGVALLSGGVDSLHLLTRNRQLYRPGHPAYIKDAIFVHGFDIGKRRRDPENERYSAALQQLARLAAEAEVRLIPCRTNLRHLPSRPGFWEYRHSGAALAAVGHAATLDPAFVFIGGTFCLNNPVPWGSHPAVDGLLSSQRVTVVHDGARFSRLEKVRDVASWPAALAILRPCPAEPGFEANCGKCEKCLRTRLELLAAGIDETAALGPSLTPIELWEDIAPADVGERIIFYEELLPVLRSRGFANICDVIDEKLAIYQRRGRRRIALA
jgi:hypothetical protein